MRLHGQVIITSNRDEHLQRENAVAPALHTLPAKKIIFPKDAKAGGSWFAAADDGVVLVLLNGAFKKHNPQPPYRKSRGLILLEIIEANEPLSFFKVISLENIEPFTIVLYQPDQLYELRWDGKNKHEKQLDAAGSYIWSSATLYNDEIIAYREELFEQFIHSAAITAKGIYDFHASNNGDTENGFIISRKTGMKTFSITQAVVNDDAVNFLHSDLLQQQEYAEVLPLKQTA